MSRGNSTASVQSMSGAIPIRYGVLGLTLALLGIIYHDSFHSLVGIWFTSDTFAHGIFVAPISAYLIYERRHVIWHYPVALSWLGVLGIFFAGVGWWVATAADVQVVEQAAVVAMIPCTVLVFLGRRVTWQMAFPLGFLLLAVPFGDALTPRLIDFTADFVVSALRFSGIPVFSDGTDFVIPSGRWSVVSGCSGMRYLMATLTVGALFAYLNYTSIHRRIIFIVMAVLVAIVGNWLRAYGIVMIAHYSGMKLALGIDHYIYGWVFFGVIIFVLMAIGSLWREEDPEVAEAEHEATNYTSGTDTRSAIWTAMALAVAAMLVWPLLSWFIQANAAPASSAPDFASAGVSQVWHADAEPVSDWAPEVYGQTAIYHDTFESDGHRVGMFVAWYASQKQGAEVVNAKNRLIYEKHKVWSEKRGGTIEPGGIDGLETVLESRLSSASKQLLIWRWYWIGGRSSSTALKAKLHQLISQLTGRGTAGAWLVSYTEVGDEGMPAAREGLRKFLAFHYPNLTRVLDDAID